MIFDKMILAVVMIGLTPGAFANALPTADGRSLQSATVVIQTSQLAAQSTAPAAVNTDFGTYVVQPQFAAVERNGNPVQGVVAEFGSRRIVAVKKTQVDQAKSRVQTNTVVRNLMNGELGIVTGRLTILTQDSAALANAINALGLKQLKSINRGTLVIVEAPEGADLLTIQTKLNAVSGVRKVKLDVLERLNEPQ